MKSYLTLGGNRNVGTGSGYECRAILETWTDELGHELGDLSVFTRDSIRDHCAGQSVILGVRERVMSRLKRRGWTAVESRHSGGVAGYSLVRARG